jgi:hypothetical protein
VKDRTIDIPGFLHRSADGRTMVIVDDPIRGEPARVVVERLRENARALGIHFADLGKRLDEVPPLEPLHEFPLVPTKLIEVSFEVSDEARRAEARRYREMVAIIAALGAPR